MCIQYQKFKNTSGLEMKQKLAYAILLNTDTLFIKLYLLNGVSLHNNIVKIEREYGYHNDY